jgi:hypothetical protein
MRHTHILESMDVHEARKFGRDVAANVLANVLTLLVVYLGAVAGGYLKANSWLIGVSVLITTVTLATLLADAGLRRLRQRVRPR